jgi:hypothetical protein
MEQKDESQRKAGLLAAKNWLFDLGYYDLSGALGSGSTPDLRGVKATMTTLSEIVVIVETEASIDSDLAQKRMCEWSDWRLRLVEIRCIALFVPFSRLEQAQLELPIYEKVHGF